MPWPKTGSGLKSLNVVPTGVWADCNYLKGRVGGGVMRWRQNRCNSLPCTVRISRQGLVVCYVVCL